LRFILGQLCNKAYKTENLINGLIRLTLGELKWPSHEAVQCE
jgi:hypothetical protein